jgi:hypothetical protein
MNIWLIKNGKRKIHIKLQPEYKDLENILLKIGGNKIVYIENPAVKSVVEVGKILKYKPILKEMEQSHCHDNVYKLWKKSRNKIRMATGWALTKDDGMWRCHSWGVSKNRIIETTTKRDIYFGFIYT